MKREYRTGLHISSYVLAHAVYEFLICAVEAPIIFMIVFIRNFSHVPNSGLIFAGSVDMYITFWLILFGADMLALMISCVVKTESTAMTVMPFVLIIQLVMAGMIFELEGVTETISLFTLSKWGFDGVCAIANTNESLYASYVLAQKTGVAPEIETLLTVWMFLAIFSLLYVLIGVIALKMVDRDKR